MGSLWLDLIRSHVWRFNGQELGFKAYRAAGKLPCLELSTSYLTGVDLQIIRRFAWSSQILTSASVSLSASWWLMPVWRV